MYCLITYLSIFANADLASEPFLNLLATISDQCTISDKMLFSHGPFGSSDDSDLLSHCSVQETKEKERDRREHSHRHLFIAQYYLS